MLLAQARKLIIFVIGGTVVAIGVVMFVTPGPALVVIPVGLGILATEFVWARVLLKRMRAQAEGVVRKVTGRPEPSAAGEPASPEDGSP